MGKCSMSGHKRDKTNGRPCEWRQLMIKFSIPRLSGLERRYRAVRQRQLGPK